MAKVPAKPKTEFTRFCAFCGEQFTVVAWPSRVRTTCNRHCATRLNHAKRAVDAERKALRRAVVEAIPRFVADGGVILVVGLAATVGWPYIRVLRLVTRLLADGRYPDLRIDQVASRTIHPAEIECERCGERVPCRSKPRRFCSLKCSTRAHADMRRLAAASDARRHRPAAVPPDRRNIRAVPDSPRTYRTSEDAA